MLGFVDALAAGELRAEPREAEIERFDGSVLAGELGALLRDVAQRARTR
jgi:hypothetical protein